MKPESAKSVSYGLLPGRDASIDVLKGILTLMMVAAHTVQLLAYETFITRIVSDSANLVCFSGFLFCFGFACQHAYFQPGSPKATFRMLRTFIKLLAAYLISALALRVFIMTEEPTTALIGIATLQVVPAYSEFLLAFALTILFALTFKTTIVQIARSELATVLATLLLLSTTLLPTEHIPASLGLFFGSTTESYFPLAQYFPLFLLGVYSAMRDRLVDVRLTLFATAILSVFVVHLVFDGRLPGRFPPSLAWMTLSLMAVIVATGIAQPLANAAWFNEKLSSIGANTLFYLLASNLLLFALRASQPTLMLGTAEALVAFLVLMGVMFFMHGLVQPDSKAVRRLAKKSGKIALRSTQNSLKSALEADPRPIRDTPPRPFPIANIGSAKTTP